MSIEWKSKAGRSFWRGQRCGTGPSSCGKGSRLSLLSAAVNSGLPPPACKNADGHEAARKLWRFYAAPLCSLLRDPRDSLFAAGSGSPLGKVEAQVRVELGEGESCAYRIPLWAPEAGMDAEVFKGLEAVLGRRS